MVFKIDMILFGNIKIIYKYVFINIYLKFNCLIISFINYNSYNDDKLELFH